MQPATHTRSKGVYALTRSTLPRESTVYTNARSAKKDVISTKPQKAMGAEGTFPREHREKSKTEPPCAVTLAKCRRHRGTLSCAVRASEGEAQSHLSCVRVGSVPSLGGKGEAKNI